MITVETSVKVPSVKLSTDINAICESFLFSTLTSILCTGGWWWKQLQVEVGVLDVFDCHDYPVCPFKEAFMRGPLNMNQQNIGYVLTID